MELPSIEKYKVVKSSRTLNERQMVLSDFLKKLNAERGDFPPIHPARLGMMLRFIKTKDLYSFFAECNDAKNFSKYFWFKFKR